VRSPVPPAEKGGNREKKRKHCRLVEEGNVPAPPQLTNLEDLGKIRGQGKAGIPVNLGKLYHGTRWKNCGGRPAQDHAVDAR
jgi:hypothetical protein